MNPDPIIVQVRERVRLDRFLTHRLAHVSRSRIQRHILAGDVLVDGQRVRPSHVLLGGESITIPPLEERQRALARQDIDPESLGLRIIHEDADFFVLDKPAGLVVHPVGGEFRRTVLNGLIGLLRGRGEDDSELGIVHRLDRLTSGLLLVAKKLEARRALARDVEERRVHRAYLGVVLGAPREARGVIDLHIRRDPNRPTRMQALDPGALEAAERAGFKSHVSKSGYSDPRLDLRPRTARTHWSILRRFPAATLLRLELETGRTHQIRVHLQGVGLPLLGDPLYGPRPGPVDAAGGSAGTASAAALAASRGLHRPALHAAALAFLHPRTREPMRFHSPLPADLRALLERLGG